MKKTANYDLNQWEKSDRILMDDFNADNAKIDGALKANANAISVEETARKAAITSEANARTALQTQLDAHSAFQLLRDVTTTAAANQIDINISGINWAEYMYVIIRQLTFGSHNVYTRVNNSTSGANMLFGGYSSKDGFTHLYKETPGWTLLLVGKAPSATVSSLFVSTATGFGWDSTVTYSEITTLNLVTGSNDLINQGARIQIWGVR